MISIDFYCPRWGSETMDWPEFVEKAKDDGYAGIEVFPLRKNEKYEMLQAFEDYDMSYILLHSEMKEGKNFDNYIQALAQNLEILIDHQRSSLMPRYIVSQTGREYYSKDQMAECFWICDRISVESGIPILHETHRNKWSYAAHVVEEYLQLFPKIKLALDISHWVCVSESYLEDQEEAVDLAIKHTHHLHARVGHLEGPQVTDPRAAENNEALLHHLAWWDKWIFQLENQGIKECSITTEFGPYPYMAYVPNTGKPIANQWEVNCWMKELLKRRYGLR